MTPALLGAPVVLLGRQATGATAMLDVDAAEPVFAGHYPGLPVLPGVCVIDTVRRAARLSEPARAADHLLEGVESARFLGPVYPGDRMVVALNWMPDDEAGVWRCAATITVGGEKVGNVRLRYVESVGAA
jgi:3-hydroxyacyl-[acyl-carrier-protein] dehydratase